MVCAVCVRTVICSTF